MALSEFALIARYFSSCGIHRQDVGLGVGDDCALLSAPADRELAVTMDTLVAGVHFFPDVSAQSLGHKSLAVNLSDLAAMGADPAWVTLALTLPSVDAEWLQGFSEGFCALARSAGVSLVGGDTTRGPLSISVQAQGFAPRGKALLRSGARVGDGVYVTGFLGDAGLALEMRRAGIQVTDAAYLCERLERPTPRNSVGVALRDIANAAIDVSDGLLADLTHILKASGVGATVRLADLPCSPAVEAYIAQTGDWRFPLAGGDDYELCFTVAPDKQAALLAAAADFPCRVTRIGEIGARPGLRVIDPAGADYPTSQQGWDHFV
jgi:thiamine-monophosphate kinase